jgi:transposase
MSLQAQPIPPIPEMTVRIARAAFRKGNVYMQMRDLLGTFFADDQFADLYPADGQPAYAPWRLALVCVMQFAENLTDRQAADAVRSRIDWKYALNLELTDEGFDFSVLSEFRQRLVTHEAGERLLNEMLAQFAQAGLLSSGGKQRTDSTYVLASVRALNRLELVGRTLQAALDAIAALTPEWLRDWAAPEWYTRYSQPLTTFRLPEKTEEREALAVQIGWDGLALMEAIYHCRATSAICASWKRSKSCGRCGCSSMSKSRANCAGARERRCRLRPGSSSPLLMWTRITAVSERRNGSATKST